MYLDTINDCQTLSRRAHNLKTERKKMKGFSERISMNLNCMCDHQLWRYMTHISYLKGLICTVFFLFSEVHSSVPPLKLNLCLSPQSVISQSNRPESLGASFFFFLSPVSLSVGLLIETCPAFAAWLTLPNGWFMTSVAHRCSCCETPLPSASIGVLWVHFVRHWPNKSAIFFFLCVLCRCRLFSSHLLSLHCVFIDCALPPTVCVFCVSVWSLTTNSSDATCID